jgi:hypothetical protein
MPDSATFDTTRGHEPWGSSSLSFPRAGPSSDTRRAVVPLRVTHPGKPRPSASPYGACLATHRNVPLRVEARFETAPALSSRPPVPRGETTGFRRGAAYENGARCSSPSRRPVRSCDLAERPAKASRRATWAETCESEGPVLDHSLRESGTCRAPLLAEGPEHPLSSPRVRTWLELPRTSWRCEPGVTEISVCAAPREGGDVLEDQGA